MDVIASMPVLGLSTLGRDILYLKRDSVLMSRLVFLLGKNVEKELQKCPFVIKVFHKREVYANDRWVRSWAVKLKKKHNLGFKRRN